MIYPEDQTLASIDVPPRRLARANVPMACLERGLHAGADFEGLVLVDIDVSADGSISSLRPHAGVPHAGHGEAFPTVDLDCRVVTPCFAEIHAHIDKSQTWERAPNPDGSFAGAKKGAKSDREEPWQASDAAARMNFALQSAYAHGTRSLRTHLDSQKGRTDPTWDVFSALREAWQGRLTVQAVASFGVNKIMGKYGEKVADLTASYGGIFGPVIYVSDTIEAEVERAFDLAEDYDLALDFHVDETLDPDANGLEIIARAALRRQFDKSIVCGHNCALTRKSPQRLREIFAVVTDAQIALTGLPMTNLYLQDRENETGPTWRGLMPLAAARAHDIVCAAGGDNCRDAFHPYGDFDMAEVAREAIRLGHLDQPPGAAMDIVTHGPESMMGLQGAGPLRVGSVADLVLFSGRSLSQVFARLGAPRRILRAGRAVSTPVPSFA
ncbi:MAG: cytosine deaminase [Pseudomonadota bacterium]